MIELLLGLVYLLAHAPDQCEATDRLAPPGWQGNFWEPSANQGRAQRQDAQGVDDRGDDELAELGQENAPQCGDIVFRWLDPRLLFGYFLVQPVRRQR